MVKNRAAITLLLLNLVFTCCTKGNIRSITSIQSALEELTKATPSTLVVFDVDETLLCPVDTILQGWFLYGENGKEYMARLKQITPPGVDPEAYILHIKTDAMNNLPMMVIEQEVSSVIRALIARNIPVIALTHCTTGMHGAIASMEQWRVRTMHDLGLDMLFRGSPEILPLTALKNRHDRNPLLYNSILFTEYCDKGLCLGALLDAINYTPTKIIFFDDLPSNIESVERECTKRSINYTGYIYRAIDNLEKKVNHTLLAHQCHYAQKYGKIMPENYFQAS